MQNNDGKFGGLWSLGHTYEHIYSRRASQVFTAGHVSNVEAVFEDLYSTRPKFGPSHSVFFLIFYTVGYTDDTKTSMGLSSEQKIYFFIYIFEMIWDELDHKVKEKQPTRTRHCRELLQKLKKKKTFWVLARIWNIKVI